MIGFHDATLIGNFHRSTPCIGTRQSGAIIVVLNNRTVTGSGFTGVIGSVTLLGSLNLHVIVICNAHPRVQRRLGSASRRTPFRGKVEVASRGALRLIGRMTNRLRLSVATHLSVDLGGAPVTNARVGIVDNGFVVTRPLNISSNISCYRDNHMHQVSAGNVGQVLGRRSVILLNPITDSIANRYFGLLSRSITARLTVHLDTSGLVKFYSRRNILGRSKRVLTRLFPDRTRVVLGQLRGGVSLGSNGSAKAVQFLGNSVATYGTNIPHDRLVDCGRSNTLVRRLFSFSKVKARIIVTDSRRVHSTRVSSVNNVVSLVRPLRRRKVLIHHSHRRLVCYLRW